MLYIHQIHFHLKHLSNRTGVGSGASTVVCSAYLNEISPDDLRGAIGTLLQLFITIAIVIAELLGKLYIHDPFWRFGCFLVMFFWLIRFFFSFILKKKNNNKLNSVAYYVSFRFY